MFPSISHLVLRWRGARVCSQNGWGPGSATGEANESACLSVHLSVCLSVCLSSSQQGTVLLSVSIIAKRYSQQEALKHAFSLWLGDKLSSGRKRWTEADQRWSCRLSIEISKRQRRNGTDSLNDLLSVERPLLPWMAPSPLNGPFFPECPSLCMSVACFHKQSRWRVQVNRPDCGDRVVYVVCRVEIDHIYKDTQWLTLRGMQSV